MISIEGEGCKPMDTGGHGEEKWKVLCAMLTTKCFIFFPHGSTHMMQQPLPPIAPLVHLSMQSLIQNIRPYILVLGKFTKNALSPSTDMTLLGALCLQYLGIVVCYKCYLEIFLDCSLHFCRDNSVSVIMFIDDHLVSSLTSPRHVILVPQVQRVTFKLHSLAGAEFVLNNAAHTCT